MRITINDNGKETVFEDVHQYCLFGVKGLIPQDFEAWSGHYKLLMEKAHTGYTDLKRLYDRSKDGQLK